ncbi:MAG: hypothetical protein KAU62_09245 [Candidatus Heimdallarchaeota archaeon]|nr:hypothetical protein [Candidatus Heimdallarchaeota archaeon]MCK4611325.1 hypothetical protein [Candidatus Heimdallarchaeota archaeon]
MIKSKHRLYEIVMESNPQKPTSFKAKTVVPDDIEVPAFDFENMLYEHYKKYPRTAAIVENPIYLEALMNPFKRFYLVPIALFKLKLNTILSLKWKEFLKLWSYIVLMFVPTLLFVLLPFQTAGWRLIIDIIFNVGTPILIAILLSLFYLKYTHDGFLSLTLAKRVEWLEKPVREYYDKYYDRKLPKNPLIILAALATGIGIQIPMLQIAFDGHPVAAIFGIITCIFSPFLYYIFFIAVYYMFFNTRIYSKILKPIKQKMDVYRKEYGTLLMRENYDIIWSLGDKWSRGRSISQLENIPTAGILSTLIIIIAMFMGNINQLMYSFPPPGMPTHNVNFMFLKAGQPATILVVTISALIAVLMVFYVILPLWAFSIKAKKFKIKALMELDNYIFANVVEFGEKYSEEAKRENVTMLQLREYVASMRIFPISTQKLFKTIMIIAIWVINILKIIRSVGGGF